MALSKNTKLILAIVCLLAVIGGAGFCWQYFNSKNSGTLTLYGNVDIRQVDLGFRVGGRIAEVLVDEGDKVEEGQPMARLDADILAQQKNQAAASLEAQKAQLTKLERGYRVQEVAQARANVAAAKAVAVNAAQNLYRVSAMRGENAISQKELDNARAQDREAKAKLKQAQDNLDMLSSGFREEEVSAQKAVVDEAEAQFAMAGIHLDDAVLHAPQKGIVLTRAREAGAIVDAGQTVYTLTLVNPVWLRAYVDEPNLGLIKPGMAVRVAVDAVPGKTFPGKVGFISPSAEFTPKTVETKEVRTALVYRLRIQAEDPENVMRQGMPVTIFVEDK